MAQITIEDWTLFESLNREPEVIRLCFDEPSPADIKDAFESRLPAWDKDSAHWLCLTITNKDNDEKIGVTGFRMVDGVAEVGYLILPQFHGFGFGTESLKALVNWAKTTQGVTSFQAIVTEGNIGSEKMLLKSGFSLKEIVPDAYTIGGKRYADHIYTL